MGSKNTKSPTASDITKLVKSYTNFIEAQKSFKTKYGVSDSYIKGIINTGYNPKEN